MGVSMESLSLVARLDEMGVFALNEGQTLANLAAAIDTVQEETRSRSVEQALAEIAEALDAIEEDAGGLDFPPLERGCGILQNALKEK